MTNGRRTQLALGALLAFQIVLILALRSPFTHASRDTGSRPLLPGLEAISPSKVEIRGASDGEKVSLVKSGGGWGIDELDGFPADGNKIDELVNELAALRVKRPVVSSGRYHDAFKVGDSDYEARIRLWSDGTDDPAADLIVGKSSNYQTCNVRRAGEDPVFEVHGLTPYHVRPDAAAWIVTELMDAPRDEVTGLVVRNASGEFELEKGDDDGWTVKSPASSAGTALDGEEVDALVRAATSVRLAEAAGKLDEAKQGLAQPAATLALRWRADSADAGLEEQTLRVGSKVPDDDSRRYVTRSGFGHAGIVWDSSVKRLLDANLEGLAAAAGDAPSAD